MTADMLAPPSSAIGPVAWVRQNLFSSWANGALTVTMTGILSWFTILVAEWAISDARWGVVTANLKLFLVGRYPADQLWRVWLVLAVLSVLAGLSARVYGRATRTLATGLAGTQLLLGALAAISEVGFLIPLGLVVNAVALWLAFAVGLLRPTSRRVLVVGWLASAPLTMVLLSGIGIPALPTVGSGVWGGLLLTSLIAVVGIILSFPFGVLLAFGRRSSLPAVRILSTAYIELIRGVPLVTILFMADIMLPLFLPGELRVDRVARAMGGVTLFSAAYVAENVRGGLQAIPTGQIEAANALGLNGLQTSLHIVLPQALRAVIPANVGLFISLLKDTTLITIIGLSELLGIGRAVLAQSEWFGAQLEVYVFIGAVFFALCFMMSQASYRLEESLGVGKR